ncbi:MAG: protein kinase [Methylobacter tundripaludum]|uniref:Serine/threonine protein phosphatase PrpC n=1 Tax=Methylobacter tundripaludum TaxID=173365 RepID=A0A2S6GR10_9GAMM|nr:bifunctional protein-serine/threonine kinase/phosphatase [Methylobacter tundripaludum]MCK9635923.1 protein kinase [Methylobacter tundripaludum]PPK67672.1 serine/threonine protein phosphatase PrpC [Methylobacter tundripaludum]
MSSRLKISVGQCSDKGRKEINQDFHGVYIPKEPQLSSKGVAIALADGISSSDVSHIASQAAVTGFLEDYFCTSEAWSVKKSVQRVLIASNSWLHAQTRQSRYCYDMDRGYVCTLSAMVIKSTTAHIFHVGDSRIYRLRDHDLEQLTNDHRLWISQDKSYLSRALGMDSHLEIDHKALPVAKGDIFLFATDGVYEFAGPEFIVDAISKAGGNLDSTAKAIVDQAYLQGSTDNLTVQIVRVENLPKQSANELYQSLTELPFPPVLEARMLFDGYTIVRKLHASSRSHIYLAVYNETNAQVVIKTPSIDLRGDPAYLERFLMEDWIARRINNAHVLKPCAQTRKRNFLYVVTEFIDGQTLTQWMIDNPKPDLETVRGIVEQIAKGLRAFHRLEMLHQDLRPANIMIDSTGTVKIIDFGSTRVAGIIEMTTPIRRDDILGTAQYTAPEYFLGEQGSERSDMFSLSVIAYQMLTGKLPYGAEVAKCKTKAAQNKLMYDSLRYENREIPAWVDDAIRKAAHPNPYKRYEDLTEFIFDLRHPNQAFLNKTRQPLLERNPLAFWKGVSFILALIIIVLLNN